MVADILIFQVSVRFCPFRCGSGIKVRVLDLARSVTCWFGAPFPCLSAPSRGTMRNHPSHLDRLPSYSRSSAGEFGIGASPSRLSFGKKNVFGLSLERPSLLCRLFWNNLVLFTAVHLDIFS